MARASPVTAVEVALARRRRLRLPLALALLIGLAWVAAAAWNGPRSLRTDRVPAFGGEFDQFGYGSLSFERDSFIPHLAWQALPQLFPRMRGDAVAIAEKPWMPRMPALQRRDVPAGFLALTRVGPATGTATTSAARNSASPSAVRLA